MAHFYAQGSRGETHRLGGKSSGADAGVRGWHDGVQIYAQYNEVFQPHVRSADGSDDTIIA